MSDETLNTDSTVKNQNNTQEKKSSSQDENHNLSTLLIHIKNNIDGNKVTLGEIIQVLDSKAYGPLILIPAFITFLPTGSVPGLPFITASIIILLAFQMLISKSQPWIPQKLLKVSFKRTFFVKSVDSSLPWIRKFEVVIKSRLTLLTKGIFNKINAAIIVALAITMYPLEFVPFTVSIPAGAVTLFSLAIMSGDGVLILLGYLVTGVTIYVINSALL